MTVLYTIPKHTLAHDPSRERVQVKCDLRVSKVCLNEWNTHCRDAFTRNFHQCRNCIRATNAKKAGRAGGAKAVASGQIKQFIAAAATPESRLKAFATARAKGHNAFTSKVEDTFFELCCEWFGRDDVRRWCFITRNDGTKHNIDIHIASIATYVEVDGIYWHGLDRPYSKLSDETKRKFDHDRRLDEHCRVNGVRLVRITDKEISTFTPEQMRDRVQKFSC